MIKPKKLEIGDTIGVISPASPSEKKSDIIRATECLEAWGYKVVIGQNVNKTKGFFAASEEERAEDFNEMFRREDIDAVFVTQGGYGSAQIIHLLDFDVIQNHPKIFTGFSDITSLHLAIQKYTDLVTFHGPGMSRFNTADLTDYSKKQFFKAIAETEPIGEIPVPDEDTWLHAIVPGITEGELTGGNLTLICSSLGTAYQIETQDKILMIEDAEVEPWIFDHMMSHLRNSGVLDKLNGVMVSECYHCVPRKLDPGYYSDINIEEILEYYLKPLKIPVLYGLPLGHTKDIATIPLGVKARLDADNKKFTILESGVV
jgi:muramoyltetrapeptide carboxypeptidase